MVSKSCFWIALVAVVIISVSAAPKKSNDNSNNSNGNNNDNNNDNSNKKNHLNDKKKVKDSGNNKKISSNSNDNQQSGNSGNAGTAAAAGGLAGLTAGKGLDSSSLANGAPNMPNVPGLNNGPKVSCRSCQGLGDDCSGGVVKQGCDKCIKITGIADNANDLPPPSILAMIPGLNVAGMKAGLTQFHGKKVTVRDCASQQQMLLFLNEDNYADTGCTTFDSLAGLKNANACACKGDCK